MCSYQIVADNNKKKRLLVNAPSEDTNGVNTPQTKKKKKTETKAAAPSTDEAKDDSRPITVKRDEDSGISITV